MKGLKIFIGDRFTLLGAHASSNCRCTGIFESRRIKVAVLWAFSGLLLESCASSRLPETYAMGTDVHTHVHVQDEPDDMQFNGDRVLLAGDSIGLKRAILLSKSYSSSITQNEAIMENDFVAKEAKTVPHRLAGACAVNPLRKWALSEIQRCHSIGLKVLKIHTLASGMDLRNGSDVAALNDVLKLATALRFIVLFHGNFPTEQRGDEVIHFLNDLEKFPDLRIIIAHFLGREFKLLEGFHHPRFHVDISVVPLWMRTDEQKRAMVETMRKVGIEKFVFGSDWPVIHPAEIYKALQALPLTEGELEKVIYVNGGQFDELFR